MTEASAQLDTRAPPPLVEILLTRWLHGWRVGRLSVDLPHGTRFVFGTSGGQEAVVSINDLRALWRFAASGSLGWAEGYIAGDWDTSDLTAFLTSAARNLDVLERNGAQGSWSRRLFNRFVHLLRANTRAGSRRNIAAHYDLGNNFYRLWLGNV